MRELEASPEGLSSVLEMRPAVVDDAGVMHDLAGSVGLRSWSAASIESWLRSSSGFGWVALRGPKRASIGELAGFVLGSVVADEASILLLAVSPAFRRHGIATRLVGLFERTAIDRKAATSYLEVSSVNAAATRFYEVCGYRATARRKSYYPDGEDALIMSRSLFDLGPSSPKP